MLKIFHQRAKDLATIPRTVRLCRQYHTAIENKLPINGRKIHNSAIGKMLIPYPYTDSLISDMNHETLETSIAEQLGRGYLQKATPAECEPVTGTVCGFITAVNKRAIVPFVVANEKESRWVFFIADSGSPNTFLSYKVSAK